MKCSDTKKMEILDYGKRNFPAIAEDYGISMKKDTKGTFWGCCPLHGEKTASLTSKPEDDTRPAFYCHGCHIGGDAAKFVMLKENISFPAALEFLAKRGGIPLEVEGFSKEEKEKMQMYRLLANVQQFFEASLAENQNGGRAYVESRMTQDMVIKNGVGYAPSGGKVLVRHLEQKKFSLLLAEKAGVIRKDDKNQYVDVFWGRVMFPVEDITGKIVGFGGRRLTDGPAKYLNSPDTPLFKKSALLYGLYSALEYIETFQEVFVVEGYLDLIQMRASGVLNSVATMGTAFTTEHAKILKKATNRVNLMFDGDPAGQKALQRSVMVAHQAEMKSQVFILPAGTDPDDFFKVPGNRVEDLETMSGLSYLHKTGAEMTDTMKSLLRLERLERGMVYLVQQIPAVAKVLGRRGNLTELFDPASLPLIDEAIAFSLGGTQPI